MSRPPIVSIVLLASLAVVPIAAGISFAAWDAGGSPVGWDCTSIAEDATAVGDGAGGAFLLWDVEGTVRVRRVDATGDLHIGWPSCGLLLSSDFFAIQHEHVQCPDGAGGVYVAYRSIVGCTVHCSGNPHAIYLQHFTGAGSTAGWPSTAIPLATTTTGFDHYDPAVASDGNGGVLVAWRELLDPRMDGGDIRAQRIAADGTVLWTAGGVGVCGAPGTQQHPAIVATPGGGALVFWDDGRSGRTVTDLYARVIAPDGTLDTNSDGVPLCAAAGAQSFPLALDDGAGGAFVLWRDGRSAVDAKFFAQHVTSLLAPLWAAGGLAVSGATTPGFAPTAVTDAAGGFDLAWPDTRNSGSSGTDLYAVRIGPSGAPAPGWPPGGLPLVIAPGDQDNVQIAPDEAGGLFAVWTDERAVDANLFGGHWRGDGALAPGWSPNGSPVCTVTGYQRPTSLVTSSPAGAIAVWVDDRQAPRELAFATRIFDAAPVPAAVSLVSARADAGGADLVWEMAEGCPAAVVVERSSGSGWIPLGSTSPDGSCRVTVTDRDVLPGGRYGYRLAWIDGEGEHHSEETWLDVPSRVRIAIHSVRRASRSALEVEFSSPPEGELTLTLLDVAGRRCAAHRYSPVGAGMSRGTLELPDAIASGVYVVALQQSGVRVTKAVRVVR